MILLIQSALDKQIYRDRKWIRDAWDQGEETWK